MSVEYDMPEFQGFTQENLRFLVKVAEFFETHTSNLSDRVGSALGVPHFTESAILEWVDEQRGSYLYYDLRRASSVADLAIPEFGQGLEDYVGYELQDDDALVMFMKDGYGDWVDRYTIVLDYDGNVSYSKEFYHGPIAGGGCIGDGESIRSCEPDKARTILRNMMRNAKPVLEDNLVESDDLHLRSFALEMAYHACGDIPDLVSV